MQQFCSKWSRRVLKRDSDDVLKSALGFEEVGERGRIKMTKEKQVEEQIKTD